MLAETKEDPEWIISIFKLRLICILGFMPRIHNCSSACGEKEQLLYFSIRDNGLKCAICAKQDTSVIQIASGTKDAIKYIVLAPAKKLFSFQVTENCKRELQLIANIYFNEKLEKEYKMEELF